MDNPTGPSRRRPPPQRKRPVEAGSAAGGAAHPPGRGVVDEEGRQIRVGVDCHAKQRHPLGDPHADGGKLAIGICPQPHSGAALDLLARQADVGQQRDDGLLAVAAPQRRRLGRKATPFALHRLVDGQACGTLVWTVPESWPAARLAAVMARRSRRRKPETQRNQPVVADDDVGAPLGFGANGAVRSAVDRHGRDAVLSVLSLPPGRDGARQLHRLAALRGTEHTNLAGIRHVVSLGDNRCGVVSQQVAGPSLATIKAARGELCEGELARLLDDLGSALGHLHERGVVHGDVSPANVIITDAGRAVLIDIAGAVDHELGTPGFIAPERARGEPAGKAGDVWALAQLLIWVAPPGHAGLAAVVEAARAERPGHRPGARDFAASAAALGPRTPIRFPAAPELAQARMASGEPPTRQRPLRPAPSTNHRRHPPAPFNSARERWRRRSRSGATGLLVLLTAATTWAGLESLAPASVAKTCAATPLASNAQARVVLEDLLAQRDAALMAADPAALADVVTDGGPAAGHDAALMTRVIDEGVEIRQLRNQVQKVVEVMPTSAGVRVEALVAQAAHRRSNAGEHTTVPAQDAACYIFVLSPDGQREWRIQRSERCP